MEYIPTILICIVVFGAIALAAYKLIKDKREGKSSCGCGCSTCPMSGKCHEEKK